MAYPRERPLKNATCPLHSRIMPTSCRLNDHGHDCGIATVNAFGIMLQCNSVRTATPYRQCNGHGMWNECIVWN